MSLFGPMCTRDDTDKTRDFLLLQISDFNNNAPLIVQPTPATLTTTCFDHHVSVGTCFCLFHSCRIERATRLTPVNKMLLQFIHYWARTWSWLSLGVVVVVGCAVFWPMSVFVGLKTILFRKKGILTKKHRLHFVELGGGEVFLD